MVIEKTAVQLLFSEKRNVTSKMSSVLHRICSKWPSSFAVACIARERKGLIVVCGREREERVNSGMWKEQRKGLIVVCGRNKGKG